MQVIHVTLAQLHQWMRTGEITTNVAGPAQARFTRGKPQHPMTAAWLAKQYALYLLRQKEETVRHVQNEIASLCRAVVSGRLRGTHNGLNPAPNTTVRQRDIR